VFKHEFHSGIREQRLKLYGTACNLSKLGILGSEENSSMTANWPESFDAPPVLDIVKDQKTIFNCIRTRERRSIQIYQMPETFLSAALSTHPQPHRVKRRVRQPRG
jgi:hypothetical protein